MLTKQKYGIYRKGSETEKEQGSVKKKKKVAQTKKIKKVFYISSKTIDVE